MPQRILYKRFQIALHILFWLTSIVLLTLIFHFYNNEINATLIEKSVVTNIGFVVAVYVNLYVLIPRFLKQKNYIFYVFWLVLLLTISSLFIQFLLYFLCGIFFVYPRLLKHLAPHSIQHISLQHLFMLHLLLF